MTYGFSSSDTVYDVLTAVTQELEVTDEDEAGLESDPTTLLPINEAGGIARVTLSLSAAAEGGVELSFTSSAPSVATLSATTVTATLTTTGDRATVTLGAVEDRADTGNRGYALQVSVLSGPGGYAGLELTVTGTVLDDDVANLVLAPTTLDDLAEGATSTVSVKLATQPTGDVTVSVSVSDVSELSVSSASLEFTSATWNTAQPVALSGVSDTMVDGSQEVRVTYGFSSSDTVYDVLTAVTQELEVTDEDEAGLESDPTTLLPINEAGGIARVTLSLSAAAEGGVELSFTSSAPSVATLSATTVTATLTTTGDRATVTLGAVEDRADTGNRGYALQVSVLSGPGGYAGLELTVTGTVLDDDVANLVLAPTTLDDLAEGATSTVSVKLATQPTGDVTVSVSVSDVSELSVSSASLEFTSATWNTAQPVALSGVSDTMVDGNQEVAVTYGFSSSDTVYDVLTAVTQELEVTDEDEAGLESDPTTLLPINEAGGIARVTLSLSAAAEGGVELSFTSSAPSVATLSATTVTATLTTTGDRATVTLGAVEDRADTGNRGYALQVSVLSGPGGYAGLELTVTGTVLDDDVANLVLAPTTLDDLAEGATSTVSVSLATQPTSDVTVSVSVSDVSELSVSSASLEFTSATWNTAQPVALSGVSDTMVDGNQEVAVTYGFSSSDTVYDVLTAVTQELEVTDEDEAGLESDPTTLLPINEAGGIARVTLSLSAAAEGGVELSFTSSAPSVATLSATTVTATLTTTGDRATVTLGAVEDRADTGNRGYALQVSVLSGPGGYAGLELTVTGTVLDDDVANLVLAPTTLDDLAEGATSTVSVKLATQPTGDVTVSVSVSDVSELSVSSVSLEFTSATWNTAQPVALSGVSDTMVDGSQEVRVTYGFSSSDTVYDVLTAVTQELEVTDEDEAGLESDPTTLLPINEAGGIARVTLSLSAAAEGGVELSFTSSAPSVATLSATTVTATLTTTGDRATVTLGAVEDRADTGNRGYALQVSVLSGPGGYAGLELTVTGTVLDDDVANLVLAPTTLDDLAEGATSTVSVKLATQPTGDVTVSVSVSDVSELSVSSVSLEFTSATWNTAQPVALSGVSDTMVDGNQEVAVTYGFSSSDTVYDVLTAVTQELEVTDEDEAGLESDPTTLLPINEAGGIARVTLSLSAAAEGGVELSFTSSAPSVATLSATTVTATLTTTGDRATVTLGAVEDRADTGNRGYALQVSVLSGPGGYAGLELTVTGTVLDDDVANLVLAPASLDELAEGATSTVSVSLATQPTGDVSVAISSDDTSEVSVPAGSLEFTPGNWSAGQAVVLTGVADILVDGTQQVMVTYVLSSSDTVYDDLPAVPQSLDVTDVDVAGLVADRPTLLPISEARGTATVTLRLTAAAEGGVALSFTSRSTAVATLSTTPLRATLTTTADRATVTLGAVDDNIDRADRGYALQVSVVSGPGGYAGLELTVSGIVTDDDQASLVLDPPTLAVLAEGATSTVSVRLATQPTGDVSVAISSDDEGEVSVSIDELVFTADNWDTLRPVTLSGVADDVVDGSQAVIVTYDLSSLDPGYATLSDVTQSLNVTDADVAALVADPPTLPLISERGGTATVTLRLMTAAEGGVTLSLTSPEAASTLTSTPLGATLTTKDDRATVTLGAVDDRVVTGNQGYALKVSVVSGPGGYDGLTLSVTGMVIDDDVANLVLDPPTLPGLAEGAKSTVMVRLANQPASAVTVAVSSSDPGELAVSPSQLEFSAANWNSAQPVMLSGSEDNLVDGTQTVEVTYAASSSDNNYGGLAARSQSQEVTDSDMGGLALEPTAIPLLGEPDGVATVTLRLTKTATSPVTLAVWSSDTSVVTLSSATLTLMSELDRGSVALGVIDNTVSGARSYELRVSVVDGVGGYAGVTLSVPGTVVDDDAAGVRFVPAMLPQIDEGGSVTLSVTLGTTPTAPVTLEVSSRNSLVATLSSSTVTLTLNGLRLSEPVIVSGVTNTLLADQPYELTVSVVGSGADYRGRVASARGIVVSDDARLIADPAELGVIPKEDGSVTVTLQLAVAPTMEVTVNIGNANPTGATLLGHFQTRTFKMRDLADRVTVTLGAVNDEGAYPRMFGLLVTVTTDNALDAGFNSVLTLRGTVSDTGNDTATITQLALAVSDLAAAGLAVDLIADNVKRVASDGPQAQVGGHSLSGLTADTGVSPSQPLNAWSDSDPWSEPGDGEWKDVMRLVPGSGFVLPLSSGAGGGFSVELWGGAKYADLSGEPKIDGVRHSYDGDALAVQVGLTHRYASGTSAGFSVGNSWVDLKVNDGDNGEEVRASHQMVSIHPYVSLAPFPDTRLLLVAGYGDGTFSIVGDEDRKALMRMAAARLERDWHLGGIDLSGKLHYLSVESDLNVTADDEDLSSKSTQSRVELEFSKSYVPSAGMSVRPYGSLGYLHESGAAGDEGSMELGAGLQGSWDTGLVTDISARYQLDGAKGSKRMIEGRLSIDGGKDRRGLLLDASQEHNLSEEADGNASVESEYKVRLGHGWGRTLWRRHGVLGAYVSTVEGSGGDGFHGPRLGLSFEALSLELVAEQGIGEGRLHLNYVSNF